MATSAIQPVIGVQHMADRSALLERSTIPQMVFSDGSISSLIPPPKTATSGRVRGDVFSITGNAVVTGGCGGLGLQAARALLEQGCSGIALLDLDPSVAQAQACQMFQEFPLAKVITKAIDVTNADNVATIMSEARTELGSIDIVLCFAGVVCTEP
ncbi:hypothetical protein PV05_11247 [Exophiala xenobiotica]|uniref:Uncharacterized protein n=1 Tax=Exophiala xenobiotica TaxID=348802 RepID=A0A0D2EP48_9EURO|nr:uncharacterized protein PV05_11247 [Exophiala xenobiotica]KIW49579.1 hypothetical protein PV05_11247 [Exophiala xenobiotica]